MSKKLRNHVKKNLGVKKQKGRKIPSAVIGGGLGGLSAAISLAAKGYDVSLFEQQAALGGKAGTKRINGYRFDTGPSLITLPDVFDSLFQRAGKRRENYIKFISLSPITHYWFYGGSTLCSDRIDTFISNITNSLDVSEQEIKDYFSYCKNIYDRTRTIFLEKSLHKLSTYTSGKTMNSLLHFFSIDPLRTMDKANRSFFSDPRMQQLFNRFATYNGSSPYQAPATLNNIAYVEHGLGAYAAENGIYGIVQGMEILAEELGVHIHKNTPVEAVLSDSRNRITGLKAGGENLHFPVIVSDADVLTLYSKLLNDPLAPLAKRCRRLPPSSSGLVFYWGIHKSFKKLGIHNIFFSDDYEKEFTAIHKDKKVPEAPTIYVNITSKVSPEDAPAGGENWFVLVNAPPHDGRDWQNDIQNTRKYILQRLSHILGEQIEEYIEAEGHLSPRDIQEETGSFKGSLYGISSNTSMAAFLRHPNFSKRYRGLYLCGGSVHPGGGMPLVTLSGMITADIIEKETQTWD